MNVLKIKKGEMVAKHQDKVMEWYLIQEGSVVRQIEFAQSVMERNSIIGIMESEWFSCDYVAREDTTLIVIPCKNAFDLQALLHERENFRPIFLRTAVEQRHQLFCLYASLQRKTKLLHEIAETMYSNYQNMCTEMLMQEQAFTRIDNFEAISMQHKAESWEISNSNSLVKNYLREYMQLMIKDDGMCVGAIMEAAAQMRRVTQGIGEMVNYLIYNRDILFSDREEDIFHLYFDLAVQLSSKNQDISEVRQHMQEIVKDMQELGIYSKHQMDECRAVCDKYNFEETGHERVNIAKEDCVSHILQYAGYEKDAIRSFKETLETYRTLPDILSTDNDARKLRREIAQVFYDAYVKALMRSLENQEEPSPILHMFFNFGFMDVKMLGEKNSNAMYNLTDSLRLFNSENIYTIYEWLRAIYDGKKEPSRNEFDMDYNGHLLEQRRQGEITEEEMQRLKTDNRSKVAFEIQNMFRSGHRITYGRISTFCPVIAEYDMINVVEKMALTAEKLQNALNKVRQMDYSVLYREIMFSDPEKGINQEWIMKEVMPDMILMPNAGTKAMMWQETSGAKSDTPARFLFPMFTAADVDEMMIETMGRYRWEICRRIQGVYWNDIREKSLTSEYCDYIQFYKKNSELSPEAKEKIKTALQRARNNYREVFVKDYQNWIKFESQGSFRLNKIARNVLVRYCPFAKEVRQSLLSNPLYQNAFNKLDAENRRNAQRLTALYEKYQAAGGQITVDLKENLKYYQM